MADTQPKRLTRKELIKRNKKIAKRRQRRFTVIALAITAVLVYITGLYGASLAYFGDFVSSAFVYLHIGGGYPVQAQLADFRQGEKMGSSLCVLTDDSLDFYSPTAEKGFSYYHAMQNPVIFASQNRIAIYNPNQTSLKIANAGKILFSKEMENDIIHVSLSKNNNVAVTTKSKSYNGEVAVYDYQMNPVITWFSAKSFPLQSFLSDKGKTLAVSTLLAKDGYLVSDIYIIDSAAGTEKFVISKTKDIPLGINFIGEEKLLVFYSDSVVLHSLQDGTQLASYSYSSRSLLAYDIKNNQIVLCLGSYNKNSGSNIVGLSIDLQEKFSAAEGENIKDVAFASSRIYALGEQTVLEYTQDGQFVTAHPSVNYSKKIIDYYGPVLMSATDISKLEKTDIKNLKKTEE